MAFEGCPDAPGRASHKEVVVIIAKLSSALIRRSCAMRRRLRRPGAWARCAIWARTPISALWLNQVEHFFALVTERKIGRGIQRSVVALRIVPRQALEASLPDPDGRQPPI